MLPADVILESAGDCVWDDMRNLFWIGFGPCSGSRHVVEDVFGGARHHARTRRSSFLSHGHRLVPIAAGEVMYLPEAFTRHRLAFIRDLVEPTLRIEVAAEDASRLAANAVNTIIMSGCGERLFRELMERDYSCGHEATGVVPAQWRFGLLPDPSARSLFEMRRARSVTVA
jgi:hypothetical protein